MGGPEGALALLGARLVRRAPGLEDRIGRIVEVEAYGGPEDRASHARPGPTARNAPMFGPPGRAYVYLVYGMHLCLNVVTGPAGEAAAVLIRAVEPLSGIPGMRAARGATERTAALSAARLAHGPGLVGAAFSIDRAMNGLDLLDPDAPLGLDLADPADRPVEPVASERVGIAFAGPPWTTLRWRFVDASSPAVSGPRRAGRPPAGR